MVRWSILWVCVQDMSGAISPAPTLKIFHWKFGDNSCLVFWVHLLTLELSSAFRSPLHVKWCSFPVFIIENTLASSNSHCCLLSRDLHFQYYIPNSASRLPHRVTNFIHFFSLRAWFILPKTILCCIFQKFSG